MKTLALADLLGLLKECEQLEKDDEENLDEDSENYQRHDVADRAEDGLSIARRLVEIAEQKLGYKRVLHEAVEASEENEP